VLARTARGNAGLGQRRCPVSERAAAASSDPANVSTTGRLNIKPTRAWRDIPTLSARRARRSQRTPQECGLVRRKNPKVGAQTLQQRLLFAARLPLQHDADRCASNTKRVRRPVPHPTGAKEKQPLCRHFYSGGGIRTRDLRVMRGASLGLPRCRSAGVSCFCPRLYEAGFARLVRRFVGRFGMCSTRCSGPGLAYSQSARIRKWA
jgi:hypothetical protein